MSSRLLNGGQHMTTEHTVVRSGKLKRKLFNSNLANPCLQLPSRIERYAKLRSFHTCRIRRALQRLWPWQLWLRDAVAAFLGTIITRWPINRWRTFYGSRAVLKSPRDGTMLRVSMRRVGLIDMTVGNATRLGASQRSTTRRCASQPIATQRLSRWGSPAARARLARTVPSIAWGSETPTAASRRLRPRRSDKEGAS